MAIGDVAAEEESTLVTASRVECSTGMLRPAAQAMFSNLVSRPSVCHAIPLLYALKPSDIFAPIFFSLGAIPTHPTSMQMEVDYSLHRLQVTNQLILLGYIDFAFEQHSPVPRSPVTYFKTIANEVTFEVPLLFVTTYATNFR